VSSASDATPSLASARAKIDRAAVHLRWFAAAWQEVVDRDDYTFVHEVHASGLNHRYRAAAVPELGAGWALVLGDCVHNVRAALDHLVHELVRADGGTPGERTHFPVQHTAGRAFVWGGVSDEARELIEAVQPFTGTADGARLTVIERLDTTDRRRHLELSVGARGIEAQRRDEPARPVPPIVKVWTSDQPIATGRTVHGYTYARPHFLEDPNVRVVPYVTIEDPLAEACLGRLDASVLLGTLVAWVREALLPRFAPCFG
jgi:hypothetical protein